MNEYTFIVVVKHRKKLSKAALAQDIKINVQGIYPLALNPETDCGMIKNVSVRMKPEGK